MNVNFSKSEIEWVTEMTRLKLIEQKYNTLKCYLRLFLSNGLMAKSDAELIIRALEEEPEILVEKEGEE